jgi:hypothetical protein
MFITMFLEIFMGHLLHYLSFLFVVEEAPLLWSHFCMKQQVLEKETSGNSTVFICGVTVISF